VVLLGSQCKKLHYQNYMKLNNKIVYQSIVSCPIVLTPVFPTLSWKQQLDILEGKSFRWNVLQTKSYL
jgi:hypothetical protein